MRAPAAHAEPDRRDFDIFRNRHFAEQTAALKGPRHALAAQFVRFHFGHRAPVEQNVAAGRALKSDWSSKGVTPS